MPGAPTGAGPDEGEALGAIDHLGLRIDDPGDVDRIVAIAVACGGRLLERSSAGGDVRHAFVADPDGAVIRL